MKKGERIPVCGGPECGTKVADKLHEVEKKLLKAGILSASQEAWMLVGHVIGATTRTGVIIERDRELLPAEVERIDSLVSKRLENYPIQYVLGRQAFMDLDLAVREGVFIPRFETERLVEVALAELEKLGSSRKIKSEQHKKKFRILDVGTGSGAVAIAIAHYMPSVYVTALEISEEAIRCARENVRRCNVSDRVEVVEGSFTAPPFFEEKFDMIVSNPPYVRRGDIDTLAAEVLREPRIALDGGEDGLDCYRAILHSFTPYLAEDGLFVFEMGEGQGGKLSEVARKAGFERTVIENDLAGRARIFIASRSAQN